MATGVCLDECLDHHDARPRKNEQTNLPFSGAKRKQRRSKRHTSKLGSAGSQPRRMRCPVREEALKKGVKGAPRDAVNAKKMQAAGKARKEALKEESRPQSRCGSSLIGESRRPRDAPMLQLLPVCDTEPDLSWKDIEILVLTWPLDTGLLCIGASFLSTMNSHAVHSRDRHGRPGSREIRRPMWFWRQPSSTCASSSRDRTGRSAFLG